VTIVELTDRLIPSQSREASKKLEMLLKKRGIDIATSKSVESVEKRGKLRLNLAGGDSIEADKALLSVGRRPDLSCIEGYSGKVRTDGGRISVDDRLRTGDGNIYAIGDCVAGPMLAHKASYDAIVACDNMMGLDRKADYSNIPNCIWTDPEIASVGLSEDEAKVKHKDVKVAKFPYLASGKAFLMGKSEGFVRIIGDADSKILGVEIMGEGACDLIAEAVLAKTAGITVKEWALSVHGHPTLSEVLQEAAHVFCGTPIHGL
jgi:dihydrolipoamide dehydrogenase